MYIPPGLMTHLNAEALECGRPGEDDPTAPTLLQYQPGQMNKPFVLDGARQQPRRQCRGGAWPKRTQPQPILQLGGMAPAVPLGSQILVDGFWKNVELFSDECDERFRWSLAGLQRATGIAQVAQHERMTEAVVIATTTPDRRDVGVRKCVVAHELSLVDRWIEQRHDLVFAQLLPSRHSCLLDLAAGRPADPGQGVDQSAALDAERAAHRGLRGAAFERRRHCREFLGIDRNGPAAAPPTPARGGQAGLHPLLRERPLELRQRAEDMEQELTLRRRGVHLLGQRTESDPARLEVGDRLEQMGQRSTEPVQLPDDQAVACANEGERLGQARTVTAAATDPILEQVTLIDADGQQRVTL